MILSTRQPDGLTLRVHLQRLAATTGRVDDRLQAHSLPVAAAALWEAYTMIAGTRQSGMGVNPITHLEICAWQALHQVRLTSWEIDTLIHVDAAMLNASAAHQSAAAPTKH